MKRRTTAELVRSYGFSTRSIAIMQSMTPHLPLAKVTDGWAKYLLSAESREEQRWLAMGPPLLEEWYEEKIALCKPKAISYNIPGGHYTPDFLYIFESGMRLSVEVKGAKTQKGYRDAVAKLRCAATLHWYDNFMMVMPAKGSTWELTAYPPDKNYMGDLQELILEIEKQDYT